MTEGPQTAGETAYEEVSHSGQPLLSRHASDFSEVAGLTFIGVAAWVALHEIAYAGPVYSTVETALIVFAIGIALAVAGLLKLSEVGDD